MSDIFKPIPSDENFSDEEFTEEELTGMEEEEDFSDEEAAEPGIDPLTGVTFVFGTEDVTVLNEDKSSLSTLLLRATDQLGITDPSRIKFRHSGNFVPVETVPEPGSVYTLMVSANAKA